MDLHKVHFRLFCWENKPARLLTFSRQEEALQVCHFQSIKDPESFRCTCLCLAITATHRLNDITKLW